MRRNRGLLAQALGRERGSVAMGHQVHGAEIQVRDRRRARTRALAQVDAQVTDVARTLTPLVLVADCVPLVLAAPGAVAAVHCGWRGVAAGIVTRAVDAGARARRRTGRRGGRPRRSGRAATRSEPRCSTVSRADGPDARPAGLQSHAELAALDVDDAASPALCVSCNPELFFSHRRDGGVTGRQAGLVWLAS